jgi:hypothetical protein
MIYRMRTNLHAHQKNDIRLGRTWRNNSFLITILFSIPHTLARRYNITLPANPPIIPTDDGIFLKKLDMETMK